MFGYIFKRLFKHILCKIWILQYTIRIVGILKIITHNCNCMLQRNLLQHSKGNNKPNRLTSMQVFDFRHKSLFVPKIKQAQPPSRKGILVSGELFGGFSLLNFRQNRLLWRKSKTCILVCKNLHASTYLC